MRSRFGPLSLSHVSSVVPIISHAPVLGVAVAGMEDLVIRIGSCSGRDVNKAAHLGLKICPPGWGTQPSAIGTSSKSIAKAALRREYDSRLQTVRDCVAHIVCRMDERSARDGHWIMLCRMEHAYVRASHWNGSGLVAQTGCAPVLTFLGSKRFAYMVAEWDPKGNGPPPGDGPPPGGDGCDERDSPAGGKHPAAALDAP